MKKLLLFLFIGMLTQSTFGQQVIDISEVAKHEGDSVTVCTRIFGTRIFENARGGLTLLNAGAKYPDAPLTLLIFGDSKAAFSHPPAEYYLDKNVCVTGRITSFKGKPQIVLTDEHQISIKP